MSICLPNILASSSSPSSSSSSLQLCDDHVVVSTSLTYISMYRALGAVVADMISIEYTVPPAYYKPDKAWPTGSMYEIFSQILQNGSKHLSAKYPCIFFIIIIIIIIITIAFWRPCRRKYFVNI